MTGAKIILYAGMDAARDGLASLAGASWVMSLPLRQATHGGHPAGQGRPGMAADGGTALIAVTFGHMIAPAADHIVLPVGWEPVVPGDEFTVHLTGSIVLAPAAAQGCSALTMFGVCHAPPGAPAADDCGQAGLELSEAAREFITSVARDIITGTGSGALGQSWAW